MRWPWMSVKKHEAALLRMEADCQHIETSLSLLRAENSRLHSVLANIGDKNSRRPRGTRKTTKRKTTNYTNDQRVAKRKKEVRAASKIIAAFMASGPHWVADIQHHALSHGLTMHRLYQVKEKLKLKSGWVMTQNHIRRHYWRRPEDPVRPPVDTGDKVCSYP